LFWQKNTIGRLSAAAQTKKGQDGGIAGRITRADCAVPHDAHRVAGCVQGLCADDDRVEVEVVVVRIPAAQIRPAKQSEQGQRIDAPAPGDAMFAIGGKGHVLRSQRSAGADLRALLSEQRGP